MADTKNETVQKMMEYPSRLQMSMLAPLQAILATIPDGDKEVRLLGYVFGEARGVSFRNNPNSADGEPATALVGAFEGVPAYEDIAGVPRCADRPGLRSGVLFLPTAAQSAVVNAVRGPDAEPAPASPKRGQRVDQLGITVPVTVEIGIRRTRPHGEAGVQFEYVTRGLANVTQESPLDRMRAQLGADIGARIEQVESGKTPAPKALAAPKKKASGKKR